MRITRPAVPLCLLLGLLGSATTARAGDAEADRLRFFESRVRPILAANCQKCHGADKQKGGLRLDSLDAALHGGDSGPAVVPGKADESLLVEAVNYDGLRMPPAGQLKEDERAALRRWVEIGAPWPAGEHASTNAVVSKRTLTDDDRAFWSFRPLARPEPPVEHGDRWSRNPIDRFVRRKLIEEGLGPAPEAGRPTLIRRLTFDLHGLPPTPEEVDAFCDDARPDAYERLVERLLASPRYGERWGRHWLDLVRYADSDGYRQDAYRPDAWRYRDYVIDSFNGDKPYDRFVVEQIAGDEVAPGDPEATVGVGYLRLGTYEYNQRDVPGQWSTILNDITDVTADVFLGLGMGCARCHDHKFDPILQRDYFRLQAFFAPILPADDEPAADPAARADHAVANAAWELATDDVRNRLAELEAPHREKAARDAIAKFPPETQALIAKPLADRTPLERQLVALAWRQITYEWDHIADKIKGKDKDLRDALLKELASFKPIKPKPLPTVMSVAEVGPEAPPTVIPGDRKDEDIVPGFLTLLDPEPAAIETPDPSAVGTGRRTVLARWLTRPDNPLSTRVIVNRVWQYHFGRGLVGTSSDFGRLGDRPSHPELLDWLAREFVDRGWSVKALHRLIVTSAAYRQSSRHPDVDAIRLKDPENRWLWRQNLRRLEVEPIRDAMLAVGGELAPAVGGPGVDVDRPRRTVVVKVIRNSRDPLIEGFDAPDGSTSTPQRNVTTTPTQALLMVNGDWTLARARGLAGRLRREAADDEARVSLAYRLAFGREPTSDERGEALEFLRTGGDEALVDFCHALLNANEFIYAD